MTGYFCMDFQAKFLSFPVDAPKHLFFSRVAVLTFACCISRDEAKKYGERNGDRTYRVTLGKNAWF